MADKKKMYNVPAWGVLLTFGLIFFAGYGVAAYVKSKKKTTAEVTK